jgi:hypothetical protein
MRCVALALTLLVFAPAAADAQERVRRVKLQQDGIQVGFPMPSAFGDGFKTGLWAPVFLKFTDHDQGSIRLPVAVDGSVSGEVLVETADNDFVLSVYPQPFTIAAKEELHVFTYAKVASSHTEIRISVKANGKTYPGASRYCNGLDLGQSLFLALGDSLPDLDQSLQKLEPKQADQFNPSRPLQAAYQNNVLHMPALWFGYNGIDLAVLTTSNGKFIDSLVGDRQASPQLDALAAWVRRGGRLVISIAPTNAEKVFRLLTSPVWRPALPQLLTLESKTIPLKSLDDLRNWSNTGRGVNIEPFPTKLDKDGKPQPRPIVRLEANPGVSVLSKEQIDARSFAPLIVRFPYGVGNITLLSFDVQDTFFKEWPGRFEFWQAVVQKLAPAGNRINPNDPRGNFGGFGPNQDIGSRLYDELDLKFDTPTISFAWVALFIFLYIIVVGPVDYLILKLVFKRLELTWVTFPAVVLTVSLLAYFTAYAIKGQDLKINKVDLVDLDLRTALGEDLQPTGAAAYGTTWFTILSPRIQSYTICIEPMVYRWQPGFAAPAQPFEPTMSWYGRPEFAGLGASGRGGRSPSLFNHTYSYQPAAVGLSGVPIPVWTTKSFTASWAVPFDKNTLPFESKLTREVDKVLSISGTLKNNLPFDLHDVGVVYRDKYYAHPDIAKGAMVQLKLDPQNEKPLTSWVQSNPFQIGQNLDWGNPNRFGSPSAGFDPKLPLRDLMFHERANPNGRQRNHSHRPLDWSWRLALEGSESPVQEIVLVAQVGAEKGQLEAIQDLTNLRLPSRIWLGEQPATQGTIQQDTYLRVLLPVAPQRTP